MGVKVAHKTINTHTNIFTHIHVHTHTHILTHAHMQLLDLLDSMDMRERSIVKLVVHEIYGRHLPFRAVMRKLFRDVMLR